MVCALLHLAYPKDHVLVMRSIYVIYVVDIIASQIFYHVLCNYYCDHVI